MKKFALLTSAIVLACSAELVSAGDITGKVTLKGTPPPETTIAYDDTCSKLHPTVPTTRRYLVGKDQGLANVFVYISKGLEGKLFSPPTTPVTIDQVGCNYNPYVFGVMVGQQVIIKNDDPLMHNIHAMPKVDGNQEFNFAETSQGQTDDSYWTNNIKKPEVLVKIVCNVHGWMFAYAGVSDNPYFALTDADGNFKVPNVPSGKYTLTAYHLKANGAKPGEMQEITVADAPVTANFTIEVPPPQ
jgi:hypothetical protein